MAKAGIVVLSLAKRIHNASALLTLPPSSYMWRSLLHRVTCCSENPEKGRQEADFPGLIFVLEL